MTFAADINTRIATDPVTQALMAPLADVVREVLAAHRPKLVVTRTEASEMLGVSTAMIDRFVDDGRLDRIAAGRITMASVLQLAGWPVVPAPVVAPLTAVPA